MNMTINHSNRMRTVLVVDDDPISRLWISAVLRRLGYDTLESENGKAALWLAGELQPDLIVLDVHMPGMNGIEASRCLRSQAHTAHIPTLIVSAAIDRETRVAAFASGALQFASKPLESDELIARVQSLLAMVERREQRQGAHPTDSVNCVPAPNPESVM